MTSVTQLIDYINHIYDKKEHALKWEVVGKEDDDVRIFVSFKKNRKLNQNKLHRLKKVMSLDLGDNKKPFNNPKKPDKSELSTMLQEKLQELENRIKRNSLDEIRMADVLSNLSVKNDHNGSGSSGSTSPKARRKNPFRRLNKGEKLKAKKGKLKLSLSVENLTLESDMKRKNELFSILERKSLKDRFNKISNDNKFEQVPITNKKDNNEINNKLKPSASFSNGDIPIITTSDDQKISTGTLNDDKIIENNSPIQNKKLNAATCNDNNRTVDTTDRVSPLPPHSKKHEASLTISSEKLRRKPFKENDEKTDTVKLRRKTSRDDHKEIQINSERLSRKFSKGDLKEIKNERLKKKTIKDDHNENNIDKVSEKEKKYVQKPIEPLQNQISDIKVKENEYQENKEEEYILSVSQIIGQTGWENCQDCKFSGFCDYAKHKMEYLQILKADAKYNQFDYEACPCNVCTLGADHNGCVYREIVRLRNCYKLFDRRNLCICSVCVPFKYRTMCLRQELRILRSKGQDEYYRLTYNGDDGRKLHKAFDGDSDSDSDEPIQVRRKYRYR